MATLPPGELERFVNKHISDRIEEYFRKTIMEKSLVTYWTTSTSGTTYTSSSSTSTTGYGGGIYYNKPYYYEKYVPPPPPDPEYIPSDEPSGKRKFEQEFKFNPAFLDMEGEENVLIG